MVDYNNPEGAIMIFDGGTPRIITIKARADISGGYWVNGSTAQGVVGSDSSTYVASDIEGFTVTTVVGSQVIGLALQTIPSGTYGPVAMRGVFLLPVESGTNLGSIMAGNSVLAGSAGTVTLLGSSTNVSVPNTAAGAWLMPVGRALSEGVATAAANQYVAISLNI